MNNKISNINIIAIFFIAMMFLISCNSNKDNSIKLLQTNLIVEDSNFVLHGFIGGLKMLNDTTFYFVNNSHDLCVVGTNGRLKHIIKQINFNYDTLINKFKIYSNSNFLSYSKMKEEGNLIQGSYSFKNIAIDNSGNIYGGAVLISGEDKLFNYKGKSEIATFMKYLGIICVFLKVDNYKTVKILPMNLEGCNPCFEDGIYIDKDYVYCSNYCADEKKDSLGKHKLLRCKFEKDHLVINKKLFIDTNSIPLNNDQFFFANNSNSKVIAFSDEIIDEKGDVLFKVKDTCSSIKYFNNIDKNKFLITIKQKDKYNLYTTTLEALKKGNFGKPKHISNIENFASFNNTIINFYKFGQNYKLDVYKIN